MYYKIQNKINSLFIILTAFFTVFSFAVSAGYIAPDGFDLKNILLVTPVFLIISLLIFLSFKVINRIEKNKLKIITIVLFSVFVLIEILVLFSFSSVQNTDAYRCFDTALGFSKDKNMIMDRSNPNFNYFGFFSNNNMFILVLELFFKFLSFFNVSNSLTAIKILNAVMIFTAVLLAFLSVKILFGFRFAVKAMFIFTLNPTLYIHIEWVYTLTFSLPVMMAILYVGILIAKEKSYIKIAVLCALEAFLSAVGYLIRPTSIFPLFAFILIAIIKFKFNKEFLKKSAVCIGSFVLIFVISFLPLSSCANAKFKETLSLNFPVTHWIMLGLNDLGKLNHGDVTFTKELGETKQEKIDGNIKEIKRRVSEKGFLGIGEHLLSKIYNTFTDGTHRIDMRLKRQQYYSPIYNYVNGDNRIYFVLYCQGFRMFTYCFAFIGLLAAFKNKKIKNKLMPFIITLLGGFVFYLLWETKQSYSLPFTLFLLTIASCGVNIIADKVSLSEKVKGKIQVKNILIVLSVILLCISSSFLIIEFENVSKKSVRYDKSVFCVDAKLCKGAQLKKERPYFNQEFYTDKDFNYLRLYAQMDDKFYKNYSKDAVIDIAVFNSENNKVVSKRITANKFKKLENNLYQVSLKFKKVNTDSYKKYIISVNQNDKAHPIKWRMNISYGIDYYKGTLNFSGNTLPNDISAEVGYKHLEQKMNTETYILLCSICLAPQIIVLLLLLFYKKDKYLNRRS